MKDDEMSFLITNGRLVTWGQPNQILEGNAVFIAGEKIAEIGSQSELIARHPKIERLDAKGQYLMPGNINAHTHFYGAFARGMPIKSPSPKDFPEILNKVWWPLDRSLTLEDVQASALVMLVEAVKHGTTTLFDHHASLNAIEGSLDVIAEAVKLSGLRAVLCYEVTDRDGPEKFRAGVDENLRFINMTQHNPKSNIRAMFGMHASLTLSDASLDDCYTLAPTGVGFHLHAAEFEADQYDSLAKSGLRVIDRLYQHHILGPDSIVAHAVHVDVKETNLLAETHTWVTHQARSNMNNAVGTADIELLMRTGVPLCLGTDGFTSTMWEEWKFVYLVQKLWNRDPRRMPADLIAEMAIYNNAALTSRFFPEAPVGALAKGAFADLILVDYHPFTPITPQNLPWHIVFGFHESMVTTTIVAGKILMQDRVLLTLNEEEIAARARELAPQVWARYNEQS